MNHKGVQFAGVESRLQPGGMAPPEEKFAGRPNVLYLRDVNGDLYAAVHTDLPEVAHLGWKSEPATKVRHRKSGRVYTVENVETATRNIRLREDVNHQTGEPMRTRWYPIDDFDVLGLPSDPAAAQRELETLKDRMVQLEQIMAPAEAAEPPAEKKKR